MGHGSRAFLAGSLGFAVAFVVACGGQNGLLSGNQAANLNGQLNSISSAVAAGRCGPARSAAQAFSNEVAALPNSVNTTLVKNLGQGATTVSELAARDCSSTTASHTSSKTTSTPTTTTVTSTTTNPTSSSGSSSSSTATNPGGTGTSTTSNGGAGIGTTGAGGAGAGANQNGQ